MTSLRFRLTLTYLAVILVGMGLAALLAWLSVERLYVDAQKANLLAQAQLVATALQTTPQQSLTMVEPYAQTANVLPGIHTRVIEEQGAVVIDLPELMPVTQKAVSPLPQLAQNTAGEVSPDELLNRPEMAQALAGQPATAIRRVAVAEGRRVLYAAVPVWSDEGQVSRIVYIASPLPDTGWGALPVSVRWRLAGAILLAITLAMAVGWWLARRISGPLNALAGAASRVAQGDLAQTVPEDASIAEVRDLGRTFNMMTASLRHADQVRTDFVADVSHELRTPLTAIKGTVETLQDGAVDDLEVRGRFLATIAGETERLIRLVNDLLVLTRADAGALNLQLGRVDLENLARVRVQNLAGVAAGRQVQLEVVGPAQHDAPVLCVLADADRIAQVLDNLLDNAIRHSHPDSRVTVTIASDQDEVMCAVSDTGSGIPAEHQPFIFERFYRADPSRRRHRGGSGLGLSIAQALVRAQQGRIGAHSVEGQGTTVTFWLPLCRNCP
jgi:signal transduction histidine kinase